MSATAVLIPFKAGLRKSRLASVLGPAQRERLSLLMLLDVLGAFRGAGAVGSCHVVSSDMEALALARREGAMTIEESRDAGVNAAVMAGTAALGEGREYFVVPSDLPSLAPREIVAAFELRKRFGCVISPSRAFDGTNLLGFAGGRRPPLSYDSDSFWNHVGGAAASGLSLAVLCAPGFLGDVDSPDDLRALSRSRRTSRAAAFAREAVA